MGTNQPPNGPCSSHSRLSSTVIFRRTLLVLFVCSLPLVNPMVHGDGVGYYAYLRAPLIQHDLRFEEDWRHANLYFVQARTLPNGQLYPSEYSVTGHVKNLFSVGPAILWAPFLLSAHGFVLLANALGAHIPADGFSLPYLLAMALGTAVYGFLGLLLSYSLAKNYVEARWAFLATLGIWGASSLPVYMYFNPAWSHAHSAFTVALFLWYWDRTRGSRTLLQWILFGLTAGLMLDVYFPNGVFLVLPLIESLISYWRRCRAREFRPMVSLLGLNLSFLLVAALAFVPTLITRLIIFGGFFRFGGYTEQSWDWSAPHWRLILFSSEHGLFSWTPIVLLAVAGLFFPPLPARSVVLFLSAAALAFYYLIASYPFWHGMSSFGIRFFISLTPIFVFGLAIFFRWLGGLFRSSRRAFAVAGAIVFLFVIWNAGLIFQWGAHLIPVRGQVSFAQVIRNQFFLVPHQLASDLRRYFFGRKALMQQIEQRDIQQLKENPLSP